MKLRAKDKNPIGKKYDRLTILSEIDPNNLTSYNIKVSCLCDCGNKKEISLSSILRGTSKSCGCLSSENAGKSRFKHGCSKGKKGTNKRSTYRIWSSMKDRCTNPNNKNYHHYGGREITVCQRWLDSFEYFLEDMGLRPNNLSLERIENDKGYSKENCKWATQEEQSLNKRTTVWVEIGGVVMTLFDAYKNEVIKRVEKPKIIEQCN